MEGKKNQNGSCLRSRGSIDVEEAGGNFLVAGNVFYLGWSLVSSVDAFVKTQRVG